MYVCICRGITDTQIKQEVSKGTCKMRDLCQRLGVAGQCGKCGILAKQILQQSLSELNSEPQSA